MSNNDTTIFEACELAANGEFEMAEFLLTSNPAVAQSAAGLDLLARIRMDEGSLQDAKALWQKVLSTDPSNGAALDALQRIAEREGLKRWRLLAITASCCCLIVGVAALSSRLMLLKTKFVVQPASVPVEKVDASAEIVCTNFCMNAGTKAAIRQAIETAGPEWRVILTASLPNPNGAPQNPKQSLAQTLALAQSLAEALQLPAERFFYQTSDNFKGVRIFVTPFSKEVKRATLP